MQYLVSVGYGEEREERLGWLCEHGYQGSLDASYPYGVVVVDYARFFGGNVTCFAAYCSTGRRVLDWNEWLLMNE